MRHPNSALWRVTPCHMRDALQGMVLDNSHSCMRPAHSLYKPSGSLQHSPTSSYTIHQPYLHEFPTRIPNSTYSHDALRHASQRDTSLQQTQRHCSHLRAQCTNLGRWGKKEGSSKKEERWISRRGNGRRRKEGHKEKGVEIGTQDDRQPRCQVNDTRP